MAKDGTHRGGGRTRAGTKPTPLINKIAEGKPAEVLDPTFPDVTRLSLCVQILAKVPTLKVQTCLNLLCICRQSKKTAHRLVPMSFTAKHRLSWMSEAARISSHLG